MASTIDLYTEYQTRIYQSPFFDLSNFYMPKDFKKFFQWARYYFLTNGLINPVISQMARYPVTGLTYLTEDEDIRKIYKIVLEDYLNLQSNLVSIGEDYYTYGNAFATIHIPFHRILICPACRVRFEADDIEYKFDIWQMRFHGNCKACKKQVDYIAKDEMVKLPKKFRIVKYYPGDIYIKYNSLTGDTQYQYRVPLSDEAHIKTGDRFYIENTPLMYLKAVAKKAKIIFKNDRLFHFKRDNIAGANMEWGIPLLMPALKKAFYLQILQKAQESIAIQHIIPLNVLFPQGNEGQSPYEMLNLSLWKSKIEETVKKWKKDPNHIAIMPFPIGHVPVFGQGRALLVTPEIREAAQQVVSAMGVPQEFVFGGLSWSASSINLRMLENQFLSYRQLLQRFITFTIDQLVHSLGIPRAEVGMADFKMIDDIQQKNLLIGLNQAGKISDETLLNSIDEDAKQELLAIEKEFKAKFEKEKSKTMDQTKMQGEMAVLNAHYQALAQVELQKTMNEATLKAQQDQAQEQMDAQMMAQGQAPGQQQMGMAPSEDMFAQYSQQLQALPPEQQQAMMAQMQQQMPNFADALLQQQQAMNAQIGQDGNIEAEYPMSPDQDPLPEQLPPRRQ